MKEYLLKNGNKPFDLTKAKTCGAKNKKGLPCKAKAMKNGKCRLHGGKYTGAKTEEGKRRRNKANFKHGIFSKEWIATKKILKMRGRVVDAQMNALIAYLKQNKINPWIR